MTWRKMAEQSGVSASTLTRLSQGKRPDVDGLASLCRWASLSADDFIHTEGEEDRSKPSALSRALMLFRADPNLKPDQAKALEKILQSAYEGLRSG